MGLIIDLLFISLTIVAFSLILKKVNGDVVTRDISIFYSYPITPMIVLILMWIYTKDTNLVIKQSKDLSIAMVISTVAIICFYLLLKRYTFPIAFGLSFLVWILLIGIYLRYLRYSKIV